jgi:hypothetical protein
MKIIILKAKYICFFLHDQLLQNQFRITFNLEGDEAIHKKKGGSQFGT